MALNKLVVSYKIILVISYVVSIIWSQTHFTMITECRPGHVAVSINYSIQCMAVGYNYSSFAFILVRPGIGC